MGANANGPILSNKEKIFLTGHTGFKGTWLTLLLEAMGHEVVGYSLSATPNSLYERLGRSRAIQEYISDIRDVEALKKAINSAKPQIVIHMAAQPLVLESYRIPRETYEINSQGTANVLEAAFEVGTVGTIGAVTTDKVYRNLETQYSYAETDALEGLSDPYSASKVAAEAVISGWKKISEVSGGPKIVTLRSGNVIGGGDFSENRLIPDLVRSHISGNIVEIRNPKSTRPWMHVLDSLIGYLRAIEYSAKCSKSDVFNFAPSDRSITVQEVLDTSLETWPEMFRYKTLENSLVKLESSILNLDPSKAINQLSWHNHWNQKESVVASIEWWKKILIERYSAFEVCQEEIRELFN